jgi:hypothetical protein
MMKKRIISGTLPDGRLQLWTIDGSNGSFQTRWKQTTDHDSP